METNAQLTLESSPSLAQARRRYFEENDFGADGGYSDAWVDFKLGPIPFPFPNTPGRLRAVRYHDLHHVVTGYQTDFRGELEIAAWEVGASCRDFWTAWYLNLGGLSLGSWLIPIRTWRAFVRGRRSQSLYGRPLEALLARDVDDVRAELGLDRPAQARVTDAALYFLAILFGGLLAWSFLFAVIPLLPIAYLTFSVQRARTKVA